jgi:hypothetical protein
MSGAFGERVMLEALSDEEKEEDFFNFIKPKA